MILGSGHRWLARAAAVLACCAALPAEAAPRGALPDCRAAWAELPAGSHHYQPGSGLPYEEYSRPLDRAGCLKEWTMLVYMVASPDLAPYAYWDLYEMEAGYRSGRVNAGSTLRTDLVVQFDGPDAEGIRRHHMFQSREPYSDAWDLSHFQTSTPASVESPVVETLPESGPLPPEAHEARFREFLRWGFANYPAKRTFVVVWGHGRGWKGTAYEASQGGYLSIPALRRSLSSVSEELLEGRPIDVYAADSCLMQMVEVAAELAPAARFIVGSTQVQNFLGLPYRRLLFELNTGRFAGLAESLQVRDEGYLLARMIPKVFRASFNGGLQSRFAPQAIREITMSALSSSELNHLLLPALDQFGLALLAYLQEDPLRAADLQFVVERAPKFLGGAQDFGLFLGLLLQHLYEEADWLPGSAFSPTADALRQDLEELRQALERTVLEHARGTRYEDPSDPFFLPGWFRAVSLWLPVSESEYLSQAPSYRGSRLFQSSPAWEGWLKFLYAPAPLD
ncbi:MAG: hypothetical protein IT285_02000 [Bdellovibrionales bacterium]|nr:hypothetical protein [Bdellovibrionales bacterium]